MTRKFIRFSFLCLVGLVGWLVVARSIRSRRSVCDARFTGLCQRALIHVRKNGIGTEKKKWNLHNQVSLFFFFHSCSSCVVSLYGPVSLASRSLWMGRGWSTFSRTLRSQHFECRYTTYCYCALCDRIVITIIIIIGVWIPERRRIGFVCWVINSSFFRSIHKRRNWNCDRVFFSFFFF